MSLASNLLLTTRFPSWAGSRSLLHISTGIRGLLPPARCLSCPFQAVMFLDFVTVLTLEPGLNPLGASESAFTVTSRR